MSHTILVVDPPQGACVERVVNTVARLGLALCHVGTAEELIERAAARKDNDPVVAVITDDTPAPLAVAERLCVAAPFAHILFVADKAAAASLGPRLHGSAALQGAHFTVSPPDEEQIAEFLVRALKVPRRLRAATRGGKPPSAVDRIRAAACQFPHMVWSAAHDGTIDYYNPEWERVLGLTVADLNRHGWIGFSHDADRLDVRLAWKRAVSAGGHFQAETRLRAGSGRWCWCRLEARQGDVAHDAGRWYGDCVLLEAPGSIEDSWRFLSEVARRVTESLDYGLC